jgi:hypothetical protein
MSAPQSLRIQKPTAAQRLAALKVVDASHRSAGLEQGAIGVIECMRLRTSSTCRVQ